MTRANELLQKLDEGIRPKSGNSGNKKSLVDLWDEDKWNDAMADIDDELKLDEPDGYISSLGYDTDRNCYYADISKAVAKGKTKRITGVNFQFDLAQGGSHAYSIEGNVERPFSGDLEFIGSMNDRGELTLVDGRTF